ncbi:MAG: hypothetical protein ABEJ70_02875 [Halobacteriaceae archaeon]
MDLDELRGVQDTERRTDSLQSLREEFYTDVADYVAALKAERDDAAERADDPFSSPEVSRLTDEIETAEHVAESLYERRMGKLVKQASFAAAGMGGDPDGLTAEERTLYEDLVDRIEENKARVLDVLSGEGRAAAPSGETPDAAGGGPGRGDAPDATEAPPEPATPPDAASDPTPADATGEPDRPRAVDAADLMGPAGSAAGEDEAAADREEAAEDRPERTTDGSGDPSVATDTPTDADDAARTTVQVTADVGEIVGVDERVYTLETDDVVRLPEANARPLLERGAATELE